MIYIWKRLKRQTKPVGKVELSAGSILLHSGETLLTKIVEVCLSRDTLCKVRDGDRVRKVKCKTPEEHIHTRLRTHLYKPYFISDEGGDINVRERVRIPLSVLEGAEVDR